MTRAEYDRLIWKLKENLTEYIPWGKDDREIIVAIPKLIDRVEELERLLEKAGNCGHGKLVKENEQLKKALEKAKEQRDKEIMGELFHWLKPREKLDKYMAELVGRYNQEIDEMLR